jgi:uncharacterized membrane protein YfcA
MRERLASFDFFAIRTNMTNLATIIIGLFVIFFSALITGITGFGFGIVSVPIMVIFIPLKTVIPIVLLDATLIAFIILSETRRYLKLKEIWPLMCSGIIGMPFGSYLLRIVDVNALRVIVGLISILFAWYTYCVVFFKSSPEQAGFQS